MIRPARIVRFCACTLVLVISVLARTYSQIFTYNTPGSDCYCELAFTEDAFNPKGVIILESNGEDALSFNKSNALIKSGLYMDYNFLIINVKHKGNSELLSCVEIIARNVSNSHKINPMVFYFVQQSSPKDYYVQRPNQSNYFFNVINFHDSDHQRLVETLNTFTSNQRYKQPQKVVIDYEKEFEIKMTNYKRNFDLGFHYAPLFLTGNQLQLSKSAISGYGLSLMQNIGYKNAVLLNLNASIKQPDQNAIQAGMQSKVMRAVQAGEDTFFVDETLTGHVLFGAEIGYRHYFHPTARTRNFITVGFGGHSVLGISGSIKDTMDISNIDMSNPSSMQDLMAGGGTPGEGANLNMSTTMYLNSLVELGLEYRLMPWAKASASIPFRYYIDPNGIAPNTFAWGLNLGLSFTLNPGKMPRMKQR